MDHLLTCHYQVAVTADQSCVTCGVVCWVLTYLSTVLGFGHSHKQLHDWLGLGDQRGHHVNDSCKLGVWLDTWTTVRKHENIRK